MFDFICTNNMEVNIIPLIAICRHYCCHYLQILVLLRIENDGKAVKRWQYDLLDKRCELTATSKLTTMNARTHQG
jgi:hypothetical protein